MSDPALPSLLLRSRFASRVLTVRPEIAAELVTPEAFPHEAIAAALEGAALDDELQLKARLRRLRQRVLLRVMARDLAGVADLAEVCGTMSELARACIAAGLEWISARLAPEFGLPCGTHGPGQPLVVVGMGKLGGLELNVSSDIDLVFVYADEGETNGARVVSNHEYYTRVGRRLISLLSDPTEDGFVFRVDMRLRPYGDSGPLAVCYDALEEYFVSQGREWERYAWIKARPITGLFESADGGGVKHALAAIVRPFVFRRYLDYGTLAAMRRLHAEVRREVARRELADNVKLGPGGIREIEFIAQALQMVRGGRDPALQAKPTLEVLRLLAERRLLPQEAADELAQGYLYLRRLEHRLQYLDDAQTHDLPTDAAERAHIAAMMGNASWSELEAELAAVRARVTRRFQSTFSGGTEAAASALWQDDSESVLQALVERGYRDAAASAQRLNAFRTGQRYAMLPEDSRQRVDALVPALAEAAVQTRDPDATLARGLDLIEAISRRAAYLALLAENPDALHRVARMIGASSWTAEFVIRHPLLLDELLDDRVLYSPPNWPAFAASLRAQLAAHEGDQERQMDVLREQHQSQVFRLLAQDLGGLLTVEGLADHLSALADLALEVTLELVWSQLRTGSGTGAWPWTGAPHFAVIAYGKLGGKELGYASDLDIIFLFDDEEERAQEVYARLARRLNSAITLHTSSGVLFDTDLRLRPSGTSGLLVSSVEGFARYQEEQAWVWEHQALTRARYCAGDAGAGSKFESIRERILRRERDPATLAREVLAMREKMHDAHPNSSGLFDLKHDRGGMIDLEFVVQFLVLAHARAHPELVGNLGNIALLGIAGSLGLIPPEIAAQCQAAYREFRRVQHSLRLGGAQYARVAHQQVEAHVAVVGRLWQFVFPQA